MTKAHITFHHQQNTNRRDPGSMNMLRRAPPSTAAVDDDLEVLRGLPAAAAPLSWASEDSVLVHSAINALENWKLKDLRRSPFRRVKSAPSMLSKIIKRITANDAETKAVSFADAGSSPPACSPPADSHDASGLGRKKGSRCWTHLARHSATTPVVRGKNVPTAGANSCDMCGYPRASLGHVSSNGRQECESTSSCEERMCSAKLGPDVDSGDVTPERARLLEGRSITF
jgi:hypothetical protein